VLKNTIKGGIIVQEEDFFALRGGDVFFETLAVRGLVLEDFFWGFLVFFARGDFLALVFFFSVFFALFFVIFFFKAKATDLDLVD